MDLSVRGEYDETITESFDFSLKNIENDCQIMDTYLLEERSL